MLVRKYGKRVKSSHVPNEQAALAGWLALSACQTAPTSQAGADRNTEFGCVAGTVGGAIVGGLLGSTIGAGSGQIVAIGGGIGLGASSATG